MKNIDDYSKMQKGYYELTASIMNDTNNHRIHDSNPDYTGILIKPIQQNADKWKNAVALDFGCGQGRNVTNMLSRHVFSQADGVDISENNIAYAKVNLAREIGNSYRWNFYVNDGKDCRILPSDTYSFVMSTIAFQHICVHEIRFSIMQDLFRSMKSEGIFSFQMGFGEIPNEMKVQVSEYYDNTYDAISTNSYHDVTVKDPNFLKNDLEKIGFVDFSYIISSSYYDHHPFWIYVKVKKP